MEEAISSRDLLLMLAVVTMTTCNCLGMVTLFRRANLVLGFEWMVMFLSGCNIVVWFFTQNEWQWNLIWFLDAFSRIAGMNLLLYLGFAKATHGFNPSLSLDMAVVFVIAATAACFLYFEPLTPAKHYAFSAAHFMFVPLLVFLSYEMYRLKKTILMFFMGLTTVWMTASTVMLDFATPADNETNLIFNKDFLSMMSWALGYFVLSRVYVALDDDRSARLAEVTVN